MNVEFPWDPDSIAHQPMVEGPANTISVEMVKKAISEMKLNKTGGPSGVVIEMIRAAGDNMVTHLARLFSFILRGGIGISPTW